MENTEVVIYRSGDGSVSVEALVDSSNETIWATQKAIAELFGINLSGISRHISNIYETGELDRDTTLAKIATPVQSGFRGTISKEIDYYNLDVIIAVGMRFSDRVTGETKGYAPKARIIHIRYYLFLLFS